MTLLFKKFSIDAYECMKSQTVSLVGAILTSLEMTHADKDVRC